MTANQVKTTLPLAARTAVLIRMGISRSREYPADETAHLFIVNPLSGRSPMSRFSTHPPMEKRIARLSASPSG